MYVPPKRPARSAGRSRFAALVTMALVAAISLTGCATVRSLLPGPGNAASRPVSGDCWAATYGDATGDYSWTGRAPRACASQHQLYTYGVASISSSARSWASGADGIDSTVDAKARDACHAKYLDLFTYVPEDSRMIELYYVPTEAQWAKGARWVRCDLGVLKTGSSFIHPSFANLPALVSTLVRLVKTDRDLFADCVNTTDPDGSLGPYDDPKATIADCTKNYQWRMENLFDMGSSDVYPDRDTRGSIEQSRCGDQAPSDDDWLTYVPTEKQWNSGDHTGECWFYHDTTPQT